MEDLAFDRAERENECSGALKEESHLNCWRICRVGGDIVNAEDRGCNQCMLPGGVPQEVTSEQHGSWKQAVTLCVGEVHMPRVAKKGGTKCISLLFSASSSLL